MEGRRRRSVEERRKIVEETWQPGASVSRVARRHDVNANQVFYWRNLYREGRLGSTGATKLLPVKVAEERSLEAKDDGLARRWGMPQLSIWWHVRAGSGDAHLDRCGHDGYAARICGAVRDGADGASGESVSGQVLEPLVNPSPTNSKRS